MTSQRSKSGRQFKYDVCLSFAGGDRAYVRALAALLSARGVRVFFDEYEQAALWGKDLYEHLDDVYRNAARYCVLFVSRAYARSVWTNHERQSAQARALNENAEYVLPVRFDNTALPGLRPTVHYVETRRTSRAKLADLVAKKVGPRQLADYVPPLPDVLFRRLRARTTKQRKVALGRALQFVEALGRMTADEKKTVFAVLLHGCPTELPDNVHIKVDLLRRVLAVPAPTVMRTLARLSSLGFDTSLGQDDDHGDDVIRLEWWDFSTDKDEFGNATLVASEMVLGATENACESCAHEALMRLDFSNLSSATTKPERHAGRTTQPAPKALHPTPPASLARRGRRG